MSANAPQPVEWRPTKVGDQLDALGLLVSLAPGERVVEAEVHVATSSGDGGLMHQLPIRVPKPDPSDAPVPHPIEKRITTVIAEGQEVSEEQRGRVTAWLRANGIDPKQVPGGPITVECREERGRSFGHRICFMQYQLDERGDRMASDRDPSKVLSYERCVRQKVPLTDDPVLPAFLAECDRARAGD